MLSGWIRRAAAAALICALLFTLWYFLKPQLSRGRESELVSDSNLTSKRVARIEQYATALRALAVVDPNFALTENGEILYSAVGSGRYQLRVLDPRTGKDFAWPNQDKTRDH